MGRTADLVALLRSHRPMDAWEAASVRRTLAYLAWLPHPFDEDADPTHVTVSGIVCDGHRVLLHLHRRLGIWLQPGGHVEGDETPQAAVLREVVEETGLVASHPPGGPALVHVDVHEGGRGHLHLDLRYRLLASAREPLRPGAGESRQLTWLPRDEAVRRTDRSAAAAIAAAVTNGPRAPRSRPGAPPP